MAAVAELPQVPPPDALQRVVKRYTGSDRPFAVEEMQGGASTRRFFRVAFEGLDAGASGSVVAMYVPSKSQEIAKASEDGRRWPFLEVRELLESRGVRVPTILMEACDDGFLFVQDLGEDTLANYLLRRPEQRRICYEVAVRDLAQAQRAMSSLPPGSIVEQRAFDEDLLHWEVEHFKEWGLEARGIALSNDDRATFDEAARYLAQTISNWPRGFVHRDYQSRNLMVKEDEDGTPHLFWIDFQDAMLGPRVYDLVALLTDSYQTFSREFIEARLDDFAEESGLDADERRALGREFDVVTVQRKLKDAGRFVFIDRVNGNPSFLQFVDPTIDKARRALARLRDDPILARLDAMLGRVLWLGRVL